MRRNFRLTLLFTLLLAILHTATVLYSSTRTLQNTVHSVSELSDSETSVTISPNHQNTQTRSKYQDQESAKNDGLSDDRVIPNTKEWRMSQQAKTFRNGSEESRSRLESRSGVRVIIIAHGRSGSSFFGGIFNAHPDFFFVYEPLRPLKRIVNRALEEYIVSVEYVVKAIYNCNFEDNGLLKVMSRHDFRRASCRSLVSPPFCSTDYEHAINFAGNQNWKLCNGSISADALNKICHKHANIASKILLERIEPVDLSWILSIIGPPPSSTGSQPAVPAPSSPGSEDETAAYVLYLVRDPRAMMFSRHRLGWVVPRERNEFAFKSGEVDEKVKEVCDMIELNLGAVLRYPNRIKLVRYEELATNPEEVVRNLFQELHVSPSNEVFRWIYNKTHGPVNLSALSLSRNASASINDWRKYIPRKLLEITEMRCARVMKYLGYLPSNGSKEVLRDLRTSLHLNKIGDWGKNYRLPAM